MAKLSAGPGKVWIDVCLRVVTLKMPQLNQAPLCASLVADHLEDVCQTSLCLLHSTTVPTMT